MEPKNSQPNFELPAPQSLEEAAPSDNAAERGAGPSFETSGGSERPGAGSAQPDPTMPPIDQASAASQALATPGAASTPQPVGSITPAAASDTDLIEKEWVEKAKAIVEQTRSDPHMQNKEINKFKADYIKKRYNKDIKVTEE